MAVKKALFALSILLLLSMAWAGPRRLGAPPPDQFFIDDSVYGPAIQFPTQAGGTLRSGAINPAVKTLVLITAGQSNWENINPTLYTPTNSSVVDNFSPYDGGIYSVGGPLLGTQLGSTPPQGPGNVAVRVADTFITNGIFSRVIIVPVAIGGTTIANWSAQVLYNRVCVAIKRLAARGITPSATGVTFAFFFGQGESDTASSTTQIAYTNSFNFMFSSLQACGLTGFRTFVAEETWDAGSVSTAVQNAQIALVNNTTIFSGGNLDTLGATNRNPDNIHFNDTGAAAAAAIVYSAMHASGSPF